MSNQDKTPKIAIHDAEGNYAGYRPMTKTERLCALESKAQKEREYREQRAAAVEQEIFRLRRAIEGHCEIRQETDDRVINHRKELNALQAALDVLADKVKHLTEQVDFLRDKNKELTNWNLKLTADTQAKVDLARVQDQCDNGQRIHRLNELDYERGQLQAERARLCQSLGEQTFEGATRVKQITARLAEIDVGKKVMEGLATTAEPSTKARIKSLLEAHGQLAEQIAVRTTAPGLRDRLLGELMEVKRQLHGLGYDWEAGQ